MKKLLLIIQFAVIILLSSCTGQKEADIGIFTQRLNNSEAFGIEAEAYRITAEGERFKYSYLPDNNTLLCIYTDSDGIVVQCTLTVFKADSAFQKRCTALSDSLLLTDCEKQVAAAFKNGSADYNGYKMTLIQSNIGQTFLINHTDDEINTNDSPTLKKHIEKDDITRPTLGAGNAE